MNFCIRKNIKDEERGSLSVEAAILLPIFLIAMLTLGIMVRMVSVGENMTHALADELGIVAADGQLTEHQRTFTGELAERIETENAGDLVTAEVEPFVRRMSHYSAQAGKTYNDLVGASVTGGVNLGLPNAFGLAPGISVTAVSRAFTGFTQLAEKMPFSELESNGDSNIVWVFPRAGEKHHAENCSVIKNIPREVLLSARIKSTYSSCELCKPIGAQDGSLVYIFSGAGKVYHLGSCFIVERFVIPMDRADAQAKGYTLCAKCGGG